MTAEMVLIVRCIAFADGLPFCFLSGSSYLFLQIDFDLGVEFKKAPGKMRAGWKIGDQWEDEGVLGA